MKKEYINPEIEVVKLLTSATILAGSEGVATGKSVGNGFSSSDISYSSEFGGSDNEDW